MELARPVGELRGSRRYEPLGLGRVPSLSFTSEATQTNGRYRATISSQTPPKKYPVQRNTFAMLIAPLSGGS